VGDVGDKAAPGCCFIERDRLATTFGVLHFGRGRSHSNAKSDALWRRDFITACAFAFGQKSQRTATGIAARPFSKMP